MNRRGRMYQRAKHLRTLVENINEYVFAVEYLDGQPMAWYHSPRCLDITGYSPEEYETNGNLWIDIVHPEDRALVTEYIQSIHSGKAMPRLEHRIIHRDSRIRWVCNTSVATFDPGGALIRLDGFLVDITDQKKSQEALEKSELKYRTLAEQMTDTISIIGLQGEIRYFSPSGLTLTGMTANELQGKTAFDLLHPDDHIRLRRSLRSLLIGASQARSEYRLKRSDGSWTWIETTSRPIRLDPSLPVIEILTVLRDISERKKTEEKLRLALDILNAEHEANFDGLISIGQPDQSILSFNRRLSELLGIPLEKLRNIDGERFWELLRPRIHPIEELDAFRQFLVEHPTTEAHLQITLDHKSTFECFSLPMTRSDESLLGRVWRFRDITRQHTDELSLLESQQTLELALHGGNLGVWDHDLKTDELFFDHRWADILGYHVNDLEPHFRTIQRLVHPDDHPRRLIALKTALESKDGQFEFECRMRAKNGTWKMILTRARVVKRDADGRPLRMSGTHMDISDRWRVHQELQQAKGLLERQNEALAQQKGELEQTNRQLNEAIVEARRLARQADLANTAKSEFLANMSHEIRTPLNAIIGFSQLLQESATDPQSRQRLEAVTSSGNNLLRLINDILDMSKIEAGAMEIRRESTDISALIHDLHSIFSFQAQAKNLEFHLLIEPKISTSLLIDGSRLRQILFNLLGNAIKFTERGSITLEVAARHRSPNLVSDQESLHLLDLEFIVRDTGCGIPESDHQIVFLPFRQRTGQSTGKFGGTGLGLTISRRLTEMMGGSISLQSSTDQGTTFCVRLPAVPTLVSRDVSNGDKKGHSALPTLSGRRILVVDDIDLNRILIRDFLKPFHPTVFEAENGVEALESVIENSPDLILMDLRMPQMDGYEALAAIRRKHSTLSIPIIALTASALDKDIQRIKDAGFDGFISKPVQRDCLLQELTSRLPGEQSIRRSAEPISEITALRPETIDRTTEPEVAIPVPLSPLPPLPSLLEILTGATLQQCENLRRRMVLGEARGFASQLLRLGKDYEFPPLIAYADVLSRHAETCNFERLDVTLQKLPQLIDQWKEANRA